MEMNKKINRLISLFTDEIRLYLSISLGVFLFVLFFQPFPLALFDFNNGLVFIAGLAGIVFISMILVRVLLIRIILKYTNDKYESVFPGYLETFVLLVINSVAFAFYLRFVGQIVITFPVMFKVVFICVAPSVVLWLKDRYNHLMDENLSLMKEVHHQKTIIKKFEDDYSNQVLDFISESGRENLKLLISDVILIQSADNYVEVFYKEGEKIKSNLIRNTLKNIEIQLRAYSNFIRCHRICIVNVYYVERLNQKYHKHWLTLKGYAGEVPVSRQYILKLKEAL